MRPASLWGVLCLPLDICYTASLLLGCRSQDKQTGLFHRKTGCISVCRLCWPRGFMQSRLELFLSYRSCGFKAHWLSKQDVLGDSQLEVLKCRVPAVEPKPFIPQEEPGSCGVYSKILSVSHFSVGFSVSLAVSLGQVLDFTQRELCSVSLQVCCACRRKQFRSLLRGHLWVRSGSRVQLVVFSRPHKAAVGQSCNLT